MFYNWAFLLYFYGVLELRCICWVVSVVVEGGEALLALFCLFFFTALWLFQISLGLWISISKNETFELAEYPSEVPEASVRLADLCLQVWSDEEEQDRADGKVENISDEWQHFPPGIEGLGTRQHEMNPEVHIANPIDHR